MSQEIYLDTGGRLVEIVFTEYGRFPYPVIGDFANRFLEMDPERFWDYQMELNATMRWKTGDQPVRNFPGESLALHVGAGAHLINMVWCLYPELAESVDVRKTFDIFFLHDAGEIAVEGGDLANTDERVLAGLVVNKSDDEIDAFQETVLPTFPEEIRDEALNLFLDYELRDEELSFGRISAHFAKWIDVVTGNRIALDYFYPEPTRKSKQRVRDIALYKYCKQSDLILRLLDENVNSSKDDFEDNPIMARNEFCMFARLWMDPFFVKGYGEEVEVYREAYPQLFKWLDV